MSAPDQVPRDGADAAAADAVLFGRLRSMWTAADPVPDDLADRMVAAVAAAGLEEEYALLTLVDHAAAVRGEAEALTLQFSDGSTSILLHVTDGAGGLRRVDGWIDADHADLALAVDEHVRTTSPDPNGRFVFDDVPAGLARVTLTLRSPDGDRTLTTPRFEL